MGYEEGPEGEEYPGQYAEYDDFAAFLETYAKNTSPR